MKYFKKNNRFVIKLNDEYFSFGSVTELINAYKRFVNERILPKSQNTYKNKKNTKQSKRIKKFNRR